MEAWRHGGMEAGRYVIHSQKSIAGVAPGQFGVVYDMHHRICLGSGTIAEEF